MSPIPFEKLVPASSQANASDNVGQQPPVETKMWPKCVGNLSTCYDNRAGLRPKQPIMNNQQTTSNNNNVQRS